MDSRGRKFGGPWQPVAAYGDGMVLALARYHMVMDAWILESLSLGGLQSWSLGGLQAWRLSVLLGGF